MSYTFYEPEADTTGQTFRYRFYDLMTMEYYGDLPLQGVTFGQRLNVAGQFGATLNLTDPRIQMLDPLLGTRPSRTLLIVDLNGGIAWGGIVWTREFSRTKPVIQLGGNECGSYWEHRVQAKDYTNTWSATPGDALVIAETVINDAKAVAGSAFATMPIARTYVTPITPAQYVSVSYPVKQLQTVDSIVSNLVAMGYGIGFDYTYVWRYSAGPPNPVPEGVPYLKLFLSYPRSGRSPDYTLSGPIQVLSVQPAYDYSYPEDGTTQANRVYGIGSSASGASFDSGIADPTSLAAGYPLLDEVANFSQVNTTEQLSALMVGELYTHSKVPALPVVDVPPTGVFALGLGNEAEGFFCGDDVRLIVPNQVQVPPVADERFPGGEDAG